MIFVLLFGGIMWLIIGIMDINLSEKKQHKCIGIKIASDFLIVGWYFSLALSKILG